jgi:hypothetical protein
VLDRQNRQNKQNRQEMHKMRKERTRREQDWYDLEIPRPASPGTVDGGYRLAAATVEQAIKDLHKRKPLIALDALLWFCHDGYLWLDALGFYVEPGRLLPLAAGGEQNG